MSKLPSITMAFDPDSRLLLSAYETSDDIGKVLRIHLMLEQQIDKLIETQTRAKVDRRTSFWTKVNLMRAMSIPESVCVAAEALNDLRNQFAHNAKATINNTKSHSDRFLQIVAELFPKLPESRGKLVNKSTGVEHALDYANADQAIRVIVAGFILSSLVGILPKLYLLGKPLKLASLQGASL